MANGREQTNLDLRDIVSEMTEAIQQIHESLVLSMEIEAALAKSTDEEKAFLIGRLRAILGRYAVLALTRLFEPEDDRYSTISIPRALNYIRFHADYLNIMVRQSVVKKLVMFGHDEKQFDGIADPWLTQLLRKEFADRLPKLEKAKIDHASRSLDALMTIRDSSVTADVMREVEMHARPLLEYAVDFVDTVRFGYLDANYPSGNGHPTTTPEADRLVAAFRKLIN